MLISGEITGNAVKGEIKRGGGGRKRNEGRQEGREGRQERRQEGRQAIKISHNFNMPKKKKNHSTLFKQHPLCIRVHPLCIPVKKLGISR